MIPQIIKDLFSSKPRQNTFVRYTLADFKEKSQSDALIDFIRKSWSAGVSRSELTDLVVNGFRVANITARITDARAKLAPSETIECKEYSRIKNHRTTRYFIVPVDPQL